jgi:hypothetical protein
MSSEKRTRGQNQQKPWARKPEDGLSVLRLPLDVSDPVQRRRIEGMFEAAYQVRRAVQRDARDRSRAYWAAHHERDRIAAAVRDRLGLSRTALEHAAYAHLDAAPHLRRFVTKAAAMHLADSVWTATERHLFRDASGRRQGAQKIGRWYDFTRLPGRARSHTTDRKWETARLHGSLAGHRAAYTRDGDFVQPRRLGAVQSTAWWRYDGPLMIVFSGLADGTLVLPVRLPTAPANQPILDHHLADPSRWHKIDLVRRQDPHPAGGWRYEAHLMVLTRPYASPATVARRATIVIAAIERVAGVDVNVSNITVASHENGRAMRVTLITALDREAKAVAALAGARGAMQRIATHTTALSQHCPCGQRVDKRLSDRVHNCPSCRLSGDRDAASAVLASFVVLSEPDEPSSARVDYDAAADALTEIRRALGPSYSGWQDTLSESTDLSARDGSFIAWSTSTPGSGLVARRIVGTAPCPILNETGYRQTTSGRVRWRTNLSRAATIIGRDFRDSS